MIDLSQWRASIGGWNSRCTSYCCPSSSPNKISAVGDCLGALAVLCGCQVMMSLLSVVLGLRLILMLSGDIELNPGPGQPPELNDVFRLLKHHSADWDNIGRDLKVDKNFRDGLHKEGVMKSHDSKLEDVLHMWIESCSKVSWDHLMIVLHYDLKMTNTARKIKEYLLNNDEAKEKYQWKVSIVPEWCHHGLSSLQYEILPVYRTIKHFHKHKQNNEELFTDPIYTSNGGYKAILGVYPNGYASGKGTHVSVYIHLMKGPNDDNLPFPINGIFTVQMLNWKEDHHLIEKSIEFDHSIPIERRERVTRGERAVGRGIHQFLSHNDVASMNVLYEDMMCFKISYTPFNIRTGCSPVPSWCDVKYSTSTTPTCTRTLYSYTAYKKTNSAWYSQPFYSTDNGYKLQLKVDANGDGSGKGTHLSLYVFLMKGDYDDTLSWPFNANITVQLLNWSSDSHHVEKTIDHHRAQLENRQRIVDGIRAPGGRGRPQFISHTELQDTSDHSVTFINNDICFRIISVDLV